MTNASDGTLKVSMKLGLYTVNPHLLQAVRLLEEKKLKDAEEERKWKAGLLKLYLNQSLCSLRQGKPKLAITQCRKVTEFDPKNVKAHFRLGQVCFFV